jgi:hypothetical protein
MTYQDCLDALSLVSHLYRHFEQAMETVGASRDSS